MTINLGRLSVIILIIVAITASLRSDVTAKLSRNTITKGDSVELIITASGENIEQPNVIKVGGFSVEGTATENFFHSYNGDIRRGYKFRYGFTPDRSTVIDPIEVIIDGVPHLTERIELKVIEPTYNPQDPYTLRVVSDKSELYRGETVRVDIEYKEIQNGSVLDRKYAPPKGENLWLKTNTDVSQFQKSGYNFITISYFFTPQKSGDLVIDSAKMRVALRENQRDTFGFFIQSPKWKNIISNSLNLKVKESPKKIVGDYEIKVAVDSDEVEANKPVNLTLEIRGNGNIEDIEPFKLPINSATVYEEKPSIEHRIENGKYMGYFKQKFVVIPTQSLTIDSFELIYFNPKEQSSFSIKTEPIKIKVIGKMVKDSSLKVEKGVSKDNSVTHNDNLFNSNYGYLILSFVLGSIITFIATLIPWTKIRKLNILRKIYKNDRESLKMILPAVSSSDEAYSIADTLSRKIYRGENIKVDRKRLKQIVKRAV